METDTTALVERMYKHLEAKEWTSAFASLDQMYEQLRHGAFPPVNVKPKTYVSLGIGGPVAYSLLSTPTGGAVFLRYTFKKTPYGNMEEDYRHAWD